MTNTVDLCRRQLEGQLHFILALLAEGVCPNA